MKSMRMLLALLMLAMLASCGNKNDKKQFNTFTTDSLPRLTLGDTLQGVAAPFAGIIDHQLIVAGGCNFPDTPAAEGGQKHFYSDILALSTADPKSWKTIGHLPQPTAYGSSVNTPEGILLIGRQKGNITRNLAGIILLSLVIVKLANSHFSFIFLQGFALGLPPANLCTNTKDPLLFRPGSHNCF